MYIVNRISSAFFEEWAEDLTVDRLSCIGFIVLLQKLCLQWIMSTKSRITSADEYVFFSGLFCVVPGSYKLKYDDGVKIKGRLKLEQTVEKKIEGVSGLILRLKDEDGMGLVDGYSQMTLADGETDKMITFLSSEPGTEQDFVFVNEFGDEYAEDVMTKTNSFSLENLSVTYVGDSDQQLEDLENS